jgi:hypothetical protein
MPVEVEVRDLDIAGVGLIGGDPRGRGLQLLPRVEQDEVVEVVVGRVAVGVVHPGDEVGQPVAVDVRDLDPADLTPEVELPVRLGREGDLVGPGRPAGVVGRGGAGRDGGPVVVRDLDVHGLSGGGRAAHEKDGGGKTKHGTLQLALALLVIVAGGGERPRPLAAPAAPSPSFGREAG